MASKKQAAIGFIFITLLIDITGIGLIIPVMPKLLEELTGEGISHAAKYGGWLTFTYAIMQFLFAPMLGALSDKFGRRPVLLFALFGAAIDYLFLSFAPTLFWLFIGRAISGITGASFTTATAYIADISNVETRAKNFGIIGAAFGLGFILGPVIGGLLGSFGPRVPFMAAAILSFLNWLYGYFILPESLPIENRRQFNPKSMVPGKSLLELKRHPELGGLVGAFVLIYLAAHAVQSNWSYFTIEKFHWSEKTIGISLGVVGLLVALVQGVLVRFTHPKLGSEKSVYIGLSFYSFGLFLFAFATQGWMMFLFLIPYCMGGIAGPALQSIIASKVPNNEQGEIQGALTGIMSLTSIVGPQLMTGLFAYFTKPSTPFHFSGVSFLLGALLMLVSVIVTFRTLHKPQAVL